MDSRYQSAGDNKGGSLDFCFFVPVLNSFQYQEKEVRKKGKIYEANTFKESALELSGFYSNDGRGETL
jgi:hypothetical protein